VRALRAVAASAVLVGVLAGCERTGGSEDDGSTVRTADPSEDPDYWTEERMRSAIPGPMPTP